MSLFGEPPSAPETIDADTIRGLRSPGGRLGCIEGIRAGLDWIGSRTLPLADALTEAAAHDLDLSWARSALGIDGDGYGYGYGYGDGDGYGYGYGNQAG